MESMRKQEKEKKENPSNNYASADVVNYSNMCDALECNLDDDEEDKVDLEEEYSRLNKTYKHLTDYTVEIGAKTRENNKHKKEKEEEDKILIEKYQRRDACHSFYCNLIREERKKKQKETNQKSRKL